MVTIDGYQLTLPCKVSDILALSEDFRADESFDYGNGTSFFQIWYKDVIAAWGIYNNNNEMIVQFCVGCNKYTKIEETTFTNPDEIFSIFKDFSKDYYGGISVRYIESDIIYSVLYSGRNEYSEIFLLWEEI